MKKTEIIEKLLGDDRWEEIWRYFAEKGMQKTKKKELMKWLK